MGNKNGIKHEFSTPKTPQQNGVTDRKNWFVQEMARVMLHSKNVPQRFWAEAVNTVIYVINRVYIKPITKNTPYEIILFSFIDLIRDPQNGVLSP